jgi:predicted HTH domain antitoxin
VRSLKLDIPEEILDKARIPPNERESTLLRELAVHLYARELLPKAAARRLSGMDRIAFDDLLSQRGVLSHLSVDDLNDDLRTWTPGAFPPIPGLGPPKARGEHAPSGGEQHHADFEPDQDPAASAASANLPACRERHRGPCPGEQAVGRAGRLGTRTPTPPFPRRNSRAQCGMKRREQRGLEQLASGGTSAPGSRSCSCLPRSCAGNGSASDKPSSSLRPRSSTRRVRSGSASLARTASCTRSAPPSSACRHSVDAAPRRTHRTRIASSAACCGYVCPQPG